MAASINEKFIAYFALLSGIAISAVAMFYSVSGLIAIYPTALIPIIIMGISIEVGKISMTLWLKQNWHAPWLYKLTMIPAVIILMIITSGGVFGFLSKAHSDQGLVAGDAFSKVQLIDDKITTVKDNISTQRENISAARTALAQLDSQVNARLDRGTDEAGAERAVQIRRNQRTERANLNREIAQAQNEIGRLNEEVARLSAEKSPLAGELRKVEAEVGPVKYIAALIYGDNPDSNLLERAVRWVTLMIVIVLDPVAILLLLASQYSFQTIRQKQQPLVLEEEKKIGLEGKIETNNEEELTTSTNTSTVEITTITYESTITSAVSLDAVSLSEIIEPREPLKAVLLEEIIIEEEPKINSTIEDLEIEDIIEVPAVEEIIFETEILELEDKITLEINDNISTEVVPTTASSEESADSELRVDVEPTEYIQNEEQKESNLWSTTVSISSSTPLTQEEYIEKLRKLKGLQ